MDPEERDCSNNRSSGRRRRRRGLRLPSSDKYEGSGRRNQYLYQQQQEEEKAPKEGKNTSSKRTFIVKDINRRKRDMASKCYCVPVLRGLFLLYSSCVFYLTLPLGFCTQYGDAEHITAILGESVVLNCPVSQPETPYIIQWKRQHHKIPIYIWYDGYDPHVEENYKDRASRVNPNTNYGLASLNLTSVMEDDQGWYECNVFYLDRTGATDNGTWIHLDVHAPPRFVTTPDDVTYVNIGDSIILNCEAEGTPTPEIMWFRDDKTVTPSDSVGIFNDGTELRINKIRDQDIGDYLCVARNAEGRVVHDAKVVIAGGAVIVNPPHNLTRLEGEKADFPCEAKALPGNVTVVWKRENVPIDQLSWLDTRSIVRKDGTLVINPTSADDGGFFTCEVSNGIGTPQRATAHLNVEYPARVTYTPTVQYLPFRQQGIIKCHIKSNPRSQFVTWIKDKRLFNPDDEEGVVRLKNGSLLITKVNQSHQGRYSCTPYNQHTTAGSSGDMEVLVREPPVFSPRPQAQYHGEVGEEVTLVCGGKGSPTPTVTWRRRDGQNLPRDRTQIHGGNLTIKSLMKGDHGFYECEVKNEIMDIVAPTQLLVEGTTPHPPYNITTDTTPFGVKLSWLPGYPGGRDYDQKYTIWYRTLGSNTWSQIDVKPAGSTTVSIHNLSPQSTYEFQVQGKNDLGDGMFSETAIATTKAIGGGTPKPDRQKEPIVEPPYPDDEEATPNPPEPKPGPKPDPPTNLDVKRVKDGFLISWKAPEDSPVPVQYYDIEYKIEGGWKKLNKENIVGETSYKVKKLMSDTRYTFRVLAKTVTSFEVSEEFVYKVPVISKEKEITAAIVGGILFFIVAIILSVCMVKICNKKKRKKQDKELQSHIFYDTGYNMVACRVGDNRNGGQPSSPVPLKNLQWTRIPSLICLWKKPKMWIRGEHFGDTTDSHPLHTSYDSQKTPPYTYTQETADEFDSRDEFPPGDKPLGQIARTTEGKFVLDKDSEEGGFTSPRKPIRSLVKRRISLLPQTRQSKPFVKWVNKGKDYYLSRFKNVPSREESGGIPSKVEGGVYDVKAGTTHSIVHQPPPWLTLRDDGAKRTFPYSFQKVTPRDIRRVNYPFHSPVSPEFGRHTIPDAPRDLTPFVKQRRIRSSSPRPYVDEWNQLAQLISFSDEMSSVRQPSSVERSFPSTVLSSFQNSAQKTPSMHGTPLNAGSLLQESLQMDYERVIREQERLLQENKLLMRQQELERMPPYTTHQRFRSRFYPLEQQHHHHHHIQPYYPHHHHTPIHQRSDRGYYYSGYMPTWSTPRKPSVVTHDHRAHHRGARSSLFHPPYRDPYLYVPNAYTLPHYANISPRKGPINQRIPGQDPYYLLKHSSSETPKPLATSSPPRSRMPHYSLQRETVVAAPKKHFGRNQSSFEFDESDISIDQPQGYYTRDRLQRAIGRVRSGRLKAPGRPHSAPNLSSAGRTSSSSLDSSKVHKGLEDEKSNEISHEQSPNSSSGFGSKNTSQQQSSSQSGQSAFALGLDNTQLETSEVTVKPSEWDRTVVNYPSSLKRNVSREAVPPSYNQWLSHQRVPKYGVPYIEGSTLLMRAPRQSHPTGPPHYHYPDTQEPSSPLYQNVVSGELRAVAPHSRKVERLKHKKFAPPPPPSGGGGPESQVVGTPHLSSRPSQRYPEGVTSSGSTQPPVLDASVDDHYEFDTLLSPTPGTEDLDSSWSRSRNLLEERGLSDSEIYGIGGRRKEAQESMEARVAAMKQEFHEYRQRQAKRRTNKELESVC